nr:uncharacterized protein LOC127300940 isoform X2 [Lolium perenne]
MEETGFRRGTIQKTGDWRLCCPPPSGRRRPPPTVGPNPLHAVQLSHRGLNLRLVHASYRRPIKHHLGEFLYYVKLIDQCNAPSPCCGKSPYNTEMQGAMRSYSRLLWCMEEVVLISYSQQMSNGSCPLSRIFSSSSD